MGDNATTDEEREELSPRLVRRNRRFSVPHFSPLDRSIVSFRYDEGKCLFSKELLTDFKEARRVTLKIEGEEKTFQFKVLNLVRQEKLGNILDFIAGRPNQNPRDAVRIIETLFKQTNRNEFLSIRYRYFPRDQKLIDLGQSANDEDERRSFSSSRSMWNR